LQGHRVYIVSGKKLRSTDFPTGMIFVPNFAKIGILKSVTLKPLVEFRPNRQTCTHTTINRVPNYSGEHIEP